LILSMAVVLPISIDSDLSWAARRLIDGASRIAIFGHQHPDADALGSALGLADVLSQLGKNVTVAVPDPPDSIYEMFIPGLDKVVTSLDLPAFDLVFALDAGHFSRYGELYTGNPHLFEGAPVINIDHHLTTTGCGTVNIIDSSAAATAELLTLWFSQEGFSLSTDAAQCLLAGVITDTRSFEFDATTPRTLMVGAYLMEHGAIPHAIIKPMYRLKAFGAAKIFGFAISTMEQDLDGKLTWASITSDMWEKAHLPPGTNDDGIPSYLLDIIGTEIAICFRAFEQGKVRISVRTSPSYDATQITTQFGGGGHARAGGCTVPGTLSEVQSVVLSAARALISGY
jgi:phosphoesterase RecJ-like protein